MSTAGIVTPLRTFQGILFRPESEFINIKAKPHWFGSYLYLCAGRMLVEYLHSLIELRVMGTDIFGSLDSEKLHKTIWLLKATSYFTIALVPAAVILKNLITAGLLYWLIILIEETVEFRKLLAVAINCWIIVLAAGCSNLLILYLRGYGKLVHLEDLKVNLGLDIVLRGNENVILKTVLENITVFSLWHLVVLVIGVSIVSGISRRRASFAAIFLWIINVAWKVGLSVWDQNIGRFLG